MSLPAFLLLILFLMLCAAGMGDAGDDSDDGNFD